MTHLVSEQSLLNRGNLPGWLLNQSRAYSTAIQFGTYARTTASLLSGQKGLATASFERLRDGAPQIDFHLQRQRPRSQSKIRNITLDCLTLDCGLTDFNLILSLGKLTHSLGEFVNTDRIVGSNIVSLPRFSVKK